ncbi:hypothetical protein GC098_29645 [Paenibacillus sp. LMG 31458]|uniref:BIG2 domain-containing protein n=1 Tax=Paenibacillus phytorum TaxID=2654977 RepID=A0ABX1Y3P4_9BACL|nr:polysaccharide lyase family 8 super-sandwich domain-containing protein [Paenibacillus phytorum]NOU75492.1 hypothetical protein [Paenibacillus phytorum]
MKKMQNRCDTHNGSSYFPFHRLRFLTVLLVVSMIISTVNLVFPAIVSAATTYVNANFDNYPTTASTSGPVAVAGGNWGLYSANIANGDYAVGEAMNGRTDLSLKLVSTTNNNTLYTARTLSAPGVTGKVVLQGNVLFKDTTHNRNVFQIRNTGSTYVNVLTFNSSGNMLVNNEAVGTYSANTLYSILAVVDSPNKTMDVYVNKQLVKSGSALPSNWDSICFFKFSQSGVSGSIGEMYLDDVYVTSYVPVSSISLPASINLIQGYAAPLTASVLPADASVNYLQWSSSNPLAASVDANGVVTGLSVGQSTITATGVDGGATVSTTVTVDPASTPVQGVSLPNSVRMAEQDTITLQPSFTPLDATNRAVTWTSDNPNVATVGSNGTVSSIMPGTANITVTTQDGNKTASTLVTVYHEDPSTWDEYDILRAKWKKTLDGGNDFNAADPDISIKIATISTNGQNYWSSMSTVSGRTYLWSDLPPSTTSNDFISGSTSRLLTMALAYSTKGSTLYHNIALRDDIISGMDWIYTNYYNENGTRYGNGYNWDIGIPLKLTNLIILLYDALSPQEIQNYTNAFDHYFGDFKSPTLNLGGNSSGSNLSDVLTSELLFGIANKDSLRLSFVRDKMSPLFTYVTNGSGIYADGSLIMHGSVAYTGTYGGVLIRGIGNLMYMLGGSSWQITDPNASNIYRWVTDVFAPIIYKGQTMDMIRGRAIARENATGYSDSVLIINGIIRLSQFASADNAALYKKMVKHWVSSNPSYNFYTNISDIELVQTLKNWMNDPAIIPDGDGPAHYELNAMARSVHRSDAFAFGVSKSSKRVQTYELTNGENGRGWYTGDGMTYVYNSDLNQYTDNFWPTVNMYRLPGTTVDSRVRTFTDYQNGDGESRPINAWAGGTILDSTFGVSGMMLRPVKSNMKANKSWFMFDNEVVALGSGITDDNNLTVESTVEQRKLNASGDNTLTVDGTVKPTTLGWTETNPSVHWAHLAGNVTGSDIGYYFPDASQLNFLREQRTGNWYNNSHNTGVSTDTRTNNFMTMWFNHGQNPSNAQYSYVLLPGKTVAETSAYAANPDITILENSTDAHAVRNNRLNITGINFWNDTSTTVDEVTSSRASSVMLKKNAARNTLEVAVSDPTLENTGVIELELNESAASIVMNDPEVFVTQLYPTIKLTVNVNGSLGHTFNATFDIDSAKPRPAATQPWPVPVNTKEAMPAVPPVTYVYDQFDNELQGNQPSGWTISLPSNTTASVLPLSGQSGQSIRMIDINPSESITANRKFQKQASNFELEWKFAVGYAGDNPTFQLMNGSTPALKLTTGDTLSWQDSSGQTHDVMSLQPNNWYKIKLNVNPVLGTFNINVDNVLIKSGALFMNAASEIDSLRISTGLGSSVVYLDDVVVYIPGANPLINETFNAYATGVHPGDWVIVDKAGSAPVSVVEDPSAQDKSVLLADLDTKYLASMYKAFPAQTERFGAIWTFREAATGQYPSFELLNGTQSVIKLTSNGTLKLTGPGGVSSDLVSIPVNVWHTIKIEGNVQLNQFDIYCDGVLVKAGAAFWNTASSVDGIKFTTGYGGTNSVMNIDNVQVYSLIADETPPVTTAVINPAAPDGQNGWYIHQPVTVSLSASEDISGVATIEYSLDGGVTWQSYTSAVAFNQDGKYILSYRSTDNTGNVEASKTISFNLDSTAPTITVSGLVYGPLSEVGVITPDITLNDNFSGVDNTKTTVTLDTYGVQQGATIALYTLPLGSHTYTVTSSDLAGNVGSTSVAFQITASIQSIQGLVTLFTTKQWIDSAGISNSLQRKLAANKLADFVSEVQAQSGKHITVEAASYLLRDAYYLLSQH